MLCSGFILPLIFFFVLVQSGLAAVELFKCSKDLRQDFFQIPPTLQSPLTKPDNNNDSDTAAFANLRNILAFKFNLRWSADFKCASGKSESYNLTFDNAYLDPKHREKPDKQLLYNQFYWSEEGRLKVDKAFYPRENYCISKIIKDDYVSVQVCVPTCSGESETCLPKCCAPGQAVAIDLLDSKGKISCKNVRGGEEWNPAREKQVESQSSMSAFSSSQKPIHFVWTSIGCKSKNKTGKFLTPSPAADIVNRAEIRILESGSVLTRKVPFGRNYLWKAMSTDEKAFCVDRLWDTSSFTGDEAPPEAYMSIVTVECFTEKSKTASKIYFSFFLISSVFALLTVIVYGLLWDKQNVHGWTVAAFSFCMLCFLISSACSHGTGLFPGLQVDVAKSVIPSCAAIAVLFHFFYIGLFSWLTVLSYDLWSTISSMAPSENRSKGYRKFLYYNCFGFGVPTAVVCIALGIDMGLYNSEDRSVYRPLYGYFRCSVDKTSFLYYATIVNMLLFSFNIILALLVIRTFLRFKSDTARVAKSNSRQSRSESILYLKLFLLMGITWIFEFISLFLGSEDEIEWYWTALDVLNLLQPVGIFWIFVCKKDMKEKLCQKYKICRHSFGWVEQNLSFTASRAEVSLDTKSSQVESENLSPNK